MVGRNPINPSERSRFAEAQFLNPFGVRSGIPRRSWIALIAAITVSSTAVQAQKVCYESYDSILLGPKLER